MNRWTKPVSEPPWVGSPLDFGPRRDFEWWTPLPPIPCFSSLDAPPRKADLLTRAIDALARIERACGRSGDQLPAILEIAADALAELRDPATGRPWPDVGPCEGRSG